MLDDEELEHGRLAVPPVTKAAWPEGFKLLEEAVGEPDVNSLPGPEDWLRALGFLGKDWRSLQKPWVTVPFLKVFKRRGNMTPRKVRLVEFGNDRGRGNFSSIDPSLSDVVFEYASSNGKCTEYSIKISSPHPVVIKRDGITKALGAAPDRIDVSPGDTILTNGWIFEFQDASLGTSW